MDVKEAYKIAKKEEPDTKAISCLEFDDSFAFFLAPMDYDEKIHGGIGGGYTVVNKTNGEISIFLPYEDFDLFDSAKEIDIKDLED